MLCGCECLSGSLRFPDDTHDRIGRNCESWRIATMQMDDLKQQLQREAAKRVSAEQQVAELKQEVKRLQAENMQSTMSASAALQRMDQQSRSLQAEVGKINRVLQAEIAELVRRKGIQVTALQAQVSALQVGGLAAHLIQCMPDRKGTTDPTRPLLCRSYSCCCIPGNIVSIIHAPHLHQGLLCRSSGAGTSVPYPALLLVHHAGRE